MTYPPQYPPPQQYPPNTAPPPQYYPQQGSYYPPPNQVPPQQQPLARGTIDDFYGQPAASGKSISFNGKPPGTTYAGVVARTMTNADIQQQTDIQRRPLFHPDGRPKYVMVVPLQLQPSAEFPDGRAAWYVKGADKTELERAMEAAGCAPGTAPEQGAVITITYTGDRPIPNLNSQKVKAITYQRPANVTGNGQPAAIPEPAKIEQPPWSPSPESREAAATQWAPPPNPQPSPAANPAGLSEDQLRLLETLRGQQ